MGLPPYRQLPQLVFYLFYRSAYTVSLLLLLALLAITPLDHIRQTRQYDRYGNVIVVACVYAATGLVALFIYASRLYTNRVTLAAIPRPYLPFEAGELPPRVRKEIVKGRQRAAIIAWETRPKDLRSEMLDPTPSIVPYNAITKLTQEILNTPADLKEAHKRRHKRHKRPSTGSRPHRLHKPSPPSNLRTNIVVYRPNDPPWGKVSHAGWAVPAPSASALIEEDPLIPFDAVITELPHLIEAQAVSLAPPDPAFRFLSSYQGTDVPPDPRAVTLLERPRTSGLRSYLEQLVELGVLTIDSDRDEQNIGEFLDRYEETRFSVAALQESEFNSLMNKFATVLGNIRGLSASRWQSLLGDSPFLQADTNNDHSDDHDETQSTESDSVRRLSVLHSAPESVSDAGSVLHHGV